MQLALTIVLIVVSILLAILVLMQEGKSQGLSSSLAGGTNETFWSKNKGRSKEGLMEKLTIVLGVIFILLSLLLSSKLF